MIITHASHKKIEKVTSYDFNCSAYKGCLFFGEDEQGVVYIAYCVDRELKEVAI